MEPMVAERLKLIVKVFRRECHRVLPSERTTIHGADSMLRVLQLAMAEVNKQVIQCCQCGRWKGESIEADSATWGRY